MQPNPILRFSDDEKQGLLQTLNASSSSSPVHFDLAAPHTLESKLVAARIYCLSNEELSVLISTGVRPRSLTRSLSLSHSLTLSLSRCTLHSFARYFLDDPEDLKRPLNHRNEAAALSLIQQRVPGQSELQSQLHEHIENLWPQFHHEDAGLDDREGAGRRETGETTASFHRWAAEVAIKSSDLVVGTFPPLGIRGCFSERDILRGEDILSIPRRALVFDETVLETDLGKMLSVIPGLGMDNLLIVFTMIDRFDDDSFWKPFWDELPEAFGTGLSFPMEVVELLQGSSAYGEIVKAQSHIRNLYEECTLVFDVLLSAYPTLLDASWFTFDRYLWAVELWYGYGGLIYLPLVHLPT